jgi:hypothetical protein
MPEADRRLRQVAQLRKLWRAFLEPRERLEDERLSRPVIRNRPSLWHVQESSVAYDPPTIRAAIRHWWRRGEYAAIVELSEQLDQRVFDAEPLNGVYVEAARACLAEGASKEFARNHLPASLCSLGPSAQCRVLCPPCFTYGVHQTFLPIPHHRSVSFNLDHFCP